MAYNRESFVQIKNAYETKKKNAIADAEAKLAVIHANYPDIKAVDEKLRQTGETISREDFNAAVNAILNAKHIYILGVRSVAPLANFLG